MEHRISIVIIEYHSLQEVALCARHLAQRLPAADYELIVSSNSLYDQARQQQAKASLPEARWVFNSANGGFAYAMNQGLRVATGQYLVIMNSDSLLETPLDGMLSFMDSHPEVGAIAPQMRDQNGQIQDTARPYVSLSRYLWRQTQRVLGRKVSILSAGMDYTRVQTVDWVIGAFIMVSHRAYELTGGLDDDYFMYAEDLDWCTRIRKSGLEVVYYPKARITYQGTRRARSNSKYARIFIRSHLHYWRKFGFFFGYPKRKAVCYDLP